MCYERYDSEEKLEANPIMHLFEVYVKINADMRKKKRMASRKSQMRRRKMS